MLMLQPVLCLMGSSWPASKEKQDKANERAGRLPAALAAQEPWLVYIE